MSKKNNAQSTISQLYKDKNVLGLIDFAFNYAKYNSKCLTYAKRLARKEAKKEGVIIK